MLAMAKNQYGNVVDLEKYSNDGRLTEPSNNKRYEWRKMIELVERLGRPLSIKGGQFYARNKQILWYYHKNDI